LTARVQPREFRWDAVGPGAGIQLAGGALGFPAKGRNIFLMPSGEWRFERLRGAGSEPPEGTLVQRNDGSLLRNDRADGDAQRIFRRLRTTSLGSDFGTWTPYSQEGQPLTPAHYCDTSVCAVDADTCPQAFEATPPTECRSPPSHVHAALGRVPGDLPDRLFFTNPGTTQRRAGLEVRLSYDEGDTWPMGRRVETTAHTVGYTAAVPLREGSSPGLGVAFEHSADGRHVIQFRQVPLAWVLCGRAEPVHIGGNAWMGAFENAIRAEDGTIVYLGRHGGGAEIRVSGAPRTLHTGAVEVDVVADGFAGRATVHPSAPGVFVTADMQRFSLDPPARLDECASPSRVPPATPHVAP
jgi:sialidase-1